MVCCREVMECWETKLWPFYILQEIHWGPQAMSDTIQRLQLCVDFPGWYFVRATWKKLWSFWRGNIEEMMSTDSLDGELLSYQRKKTHLGLFNDTTVTLWNARARINISSPRGCQQPFHKASNYRRHRPLPTRSRHPWENNDVIHHLCAGKFL